MADISVALSLNDTQYKSKLASATRDAVSFGNTFSDAADNVKSKLEGLGTVIAGVGLAEFGRRALESVSNMADLAGAIGITTQSMMELSLAGIAAGKSSDDVAQMIQKLNLSVNEANEGNTKLQSSFAALGLTMREVNDLSPDERFKRIVTALSRLDDSSKRAALSLDLIGKSGTKTDLTDLANNFGKFAGTQERAAEASVAAKEVMDKLAVTAELVKNEFVALAQPVLSWIEPFVGGANSAKIAAQGLAGAMVLFAAAGTVTAINSIIKGVGALAGAMGVSTATTAAATAALTVNGKVMDTFMTGAVGRLGTATAALATAQGELNAMLAFGPPTAIAQARALDAVAAAELRVSLATQAMATTSAAAAPALASVGVAGTTAATGLTTATVASTGLLARFSALLPVAAGLAAALTGIFYSPGLNEGEQKLIDEGKEIGKLLQDLEKRNPGSLDKYFKMSPEAQKEVREALKLAEQTRKAAEAQKFLESPTKGKTAIVDRSAIQSVEQQTQALEQNIKAQLAREKMERENIGKPVALAAYDSSRLEEDLNFAREKLRIEGEVARLRSQASLEAGKGDSVKAGLLIEQANALQKQVDLQEKYIGQLSTQKQLTAVTKNEDQMRLFYNQSDFNIEKEIADLKTRTAQLTLTEEERLLSKVKERLDAEVDAAVKIREAQQGGRKLDDADVDAIRQDIYSRHKKRLEDQTMAEYKASRSFETGWKQAFNSYAENATNAAEQARRIFQQVTGGMEDMIVSFAKTGKLEFKSFINDIVEMLLRSEIQRMFAGMFAGSGGAGGGNAFSAFGKMLGFADGGTIPTNRPVLVGERGPEIISGAAGRTVTPNHELGGTTNVTYNINAVDARSFQQLVAQDPSFIYAVTLKGQRSMPGGK